MSKLILLKATPGELLSYMFNDYNNHSDTTIVTKILPFSINFNRLIGDAATRFRNVSLFQFCYSLFLLIVNPFKKLQIDQDITYLLFLNFSAREITPYYLKRFLKKHPNCVPVMLFTDPIDTYLSIYAKRLTELVPQFLCMTYDKKDAEKFGFHHTMSIYSKHDLRESNILYDVYFSFTGINRLETVQAVTDHLLQNGINANIIVAGEAKHEQYIKEQTRGIHFLKNRKTYGEILTDISQTNCLLEILKDGYEGTTLRYYEAVCYNKKLLTNNKNIVNLPFYNPNYMKIFAKPEDIDFEWVKRRELVSYDYDNRFSPLQLLKEIESISKLPIS